MSGDKINDFLVVVICIGVVLMHIVIVVIAIVNLKRVSIGTFSFG